MKFHIDPKIRFAKIDPTMKKAMDAATKKMYERIKEDARLNQARYAAGNNPYYGEGYRVRGIIEMVRGRDGTWRKA